MASFPACNTMRGAIDATEPYQMLVRRADARPPDIKVCIVTDHGFGDQKLYRILTEDPKFDQVIRLRAKITVTAADGKVRTAAAGVEPSGRARITHRTVRVGSSWKPRILRDGCSPRVEYLAHDPRQFGVAIRLVEHSEREVGHALVRAPHTRKTRRKQYFQAWP